MHESQRQTFNINGIFLVENLFAHGQFHVAVSQKWREKWGNLRKLLQQWLGSEFNF